MFLSVEHISTILQERRLFSEHTHQDSKELFFTICYLDILFLKIII